MNVNRVAASSIQIRKSLVEKGVQASLAARKSVGADMRSPVCIYAMCEAKGVIVRFNDINMEGMYDRAPRPRIHISALRPLPRRAFTCAHELGHHLFGHGSSIDEMREDHLRSISRPPEEVLADSFAAFTLLPTLGLREAFSIRRLMPANASAEDIYAIACNFGVGQATLVNHLAYGVSMMAPERRDVLGKITPKMIRTQLLGRVVPEQLVFADEHWNSPHLDVEKTSLLLLPKGVVVDATYLMPQGEVSRGRVFRAVKTGITRVAIPGANWATFVRIAPLKYVGLGRYRHLEEDSDDEA